ncbi:Aldo/keto reductase [Gonapodya prolifera JEL478]|uniref:Aldo/keto reductase n=1 Tax=Gonapodya prolifera (strain JEL478) TaxID=1344416 RepID=A0A139AYP6_GONPJ|nr:Aldo/keto reductase [Gonapodya prolifera JEL478]|eukprot:KXS21683.1 Aldo/keto reductase [Gonapodya prolifera JEL478]
MTSDREAMPSKYTHFTTNAGVRMPRIVYGTAWKKERTTDLVVKAVLSGFRGIDTACQPKHYSENLVGAALALLQERHGVKREDLFIQTKFTPLSGQDPNQIPYDKSSALPDQVRQSIQKSLSNLRTTYIDSLLLHSPLPTHEQTMVAWRVLEAHVKDKIIRQIGVSNMYDIGQLEKLWDEADVKPSVVQNRFVPTFGYDTKIRAFCATHNISYQSFWTLTGNPHLLSSPAVQSATRAHSNSVNTPEHTLFKYLIQTHPYFVPLTGTTNEKHMKEDLSVLRELDSGDCLTEKEVVAIRVLIDGN